MKHNLIALLLIVPFVGCTQKETKPRHIIDYQGKELSEAELEQLFERELQHFESIKEDTSVVIERIKNIDQYLASHNLNRGKLESVQNLDMYNIEDKLITPFKVGRISAAELSKIVDTLSADLKKMIPHHFQRDYIPQLKDNKPLLDQILAIDVQYSNGEDGFFITVTQQVKGWEQAIEDTLRSDAFYKKEYPKPGYLLSRYAITGNNKATLELLKTVIARMKPDDAINDLTHGYLSAFEYLMWNGDADTKAKTRALLFEYLKKARFSAIEYEDHLLPHEISPEFRNLVEAKFKSLDTIRDPKKRKDEEGRFQNYYLKHYARNIGMRAMAYIKPLLTVPRELMSFNDDDPVHFKITDSKTDYTVEYALSALEELVKYNALSDKEKETILELLKNAKLQNSRSYKWRQYVAIIKAMYPKRPYEDFAALFADVPSNYLYVDIDQYWNRRIHSAYDLDVHLDYLAQLGFDTSKVTSASKYRYLKDYGSYDNEVVFWGVFNLIGASLHYDCETGSWPNPYDELLQGYLNIAPELSGYSAHFSYKKLNEDYETEYTALVFDGDSGFLSHPKDNSDWYDPNTVEKMLNTALKAEGSSKRFIQIATGDQTVLSVYGNPGQLKIFADKFGLPLLHEQDYGEPAEY